MLGVFEELVLLAILRLENGAYGAAVEQVIATATNHVVNVRGLYTALQRLERKGLVTGARIDRRKYYAVTASGKKALQATACAREAAATHRDALGRRGEERG